MRILVAEDDPFTRQALGEIIRLEGWEAVTAEDGNKAWELFTQGGFDLVCLDIMMPGRSGYDLCRAIREKDPQVALLFISAKSEELDRVLGLELGADDFIVKPFGAREVAARLRAILRRREPRQGRPGSQVEYSFGPWVVAEGELRAKKPGVTLDLTAREISILGFLYRNRGKVVSRQDLFAHCWGWENAPQSRTLDQHIAVLRKKLEEDPGNPKLISTVQGVGYRHDLLE